MGEKISIAEFAKRANVSRQSVYKRLTQVDSELTKYVNLVDNQKMIDTQALEEVYGIKDDKEVDKIDNVKSTECQPVVNLINQENQVEDMLLKQIEILQDEIKIKNDQIEQLHKLLDQEQQLRMIQEQKNVQIEELNLNLKEKKRKWWEFWKM
jgi:hypothetical protein